MPYVPPKDANNQLKDSIADIKARNGSPPWRERVAATERFRIVLLCWPQEFAHRQHHHPRADETFIICEGQARFIFDGGPEIVAGPGDVLFAPRGVAHDVTAVGEEHLLMFAIVTPNEPDDEVKGLKGKYQA